MIVERRRAILVADVPDAHEPVGRRADELQAGGDEVDAQDRVGMPLEGLPSQRARLPASRTLRQLKSWMFQSLIVLSPDAVASA